MPPPPPPTPHRIYTGTPYTADDYDDDYDDDNDERSVRTRARPRRLPLFRFAVSAAANVTPRPFRRRRTPREPFPWEHRPVGGARTRGPTTVVGGGGFESLKNIAKCLVYIAAPAAACPFSRCLAPGRDDVYVFIYIYIDYRESYIYIYTCVCVCVANVRVNFLSVSTFAAANRPHRFNIQGDSFIATIPKI